jgi:hypothetical protein
MARDFMDDLRAEDQRWKPYNTQKAEDQRWKHTQVTDKNFWLNYCREVISPEVDLACIVRHTSRSGLLREVQVLATNKGRILDITYAVACVTGLPKGKHGIKLQGFGFSATQEVADTFKRTLGGDYIFMSFVDLS